MKWLTNIYDPNMPDAPDRLALLFESRQEAWRNQQRWLQGKIIGDPKPSSFYTVDQLKKMHVVGVYAPEGNDNG